VICKSKWGMVKTGSALSQINLIGLYPYYREDKND
jgi:hypothetical protein